MKNRIYRYSLILTFLLLLTTRGQAADDVDKYGLTLIQRHLLNSYVEPARSQIIAELNDRSWITPKLKSQLTVYEIEYWTVTQKHARDNFLNKLNNASEAEASDILTSMRNAIPPPTPRVFLELYGAEAERLDELSTIFGTTQRYQSYFSVSWHTGLPGLRELVPNGTSLPINDDYVKLTTSALARTTALRQSKTKQEGPIISSAVSYLTLTDRIRAGIVNLVRIDLQNRARLGLNPSTFGNTIEGDNKESVIKVLNLLLTYATGTPTTERGWYLKGFSIKALLPLKREWKDIKDLPSLDSVKDFGMDIRQSAEYKTWRKDQ